MSQVILKAYRKRRLRKYLRYLSSALVGMGMGVAFSSLTCPLGGCSILARPIVGAILGALAGLVFAWEHHKTTDLDKDA